MRFAFLLLFLALPALAQLPAGFVQRRLAQNLNPTGLTFAPDGRLFIVEKNGRVRIVQNDVLQPEPFMLLPNVDTFNERGLTGFCFHPDFPRTPYVYAYYAVKDLFQNRLSRFRATLAGVDVRSEEVLMEFGRLIGSVHNAGALKFGKDGKLYVAVGDGAEPNHAQDMTSLQGKILRLNADGSIPADNPFYAQQTGNSRAIYALGFRNPFSMDIDPATGRLFVSNVGGSLYEEINDVRAGGNYGWALIEGLRTTETAPPNYVDPLYAYGHNQGCAIVGAAFYTPQNNRFPALYTGKFFFGDYCGGYIKTFDPATRQVATFLTGANRPVALAVSPDGYLYYLERAGLGGGSPQDNTVTFNGTLYKVSYFDSGLPYITRQSADALVPVGERTIFDVAAVGQKPLRYRWFRNGAMVQESDSARLVLPQPTLADHGATFRCIVQNALGADTSAVITLRVVAGQRPVARITQPALNSQYRAGDTLRFAGSALNTSGNTINNATLTWWIDFHHDDHTHPALDPVAGPTSGQYVVPRVGETSTNVFYRIHLRAQLLNGLSGETFADVRPVVVNVTVASDPPNVSLMFDGEPRAAGFTFSAVAGSLRTLETHEYTAQATGFYKFQGWSNGHRAPVQTYYVPAQNERLIATFQALPRDVGTGLLGEYFSNRNDFAGAPSLIRIDKTIDFDWKEGSPDASVSADNFTARWTGQIRPPFTDTYTFYTDTDDGSRLWVNGRQLVNQWSQQVATEWSDTIRLEAGRLYDIRYEYFEKGDFASARLRWSSPRFEKALVAMPHLFSKTQILSVDEASALTIFPLPAREQITLRYVATQSGSAAVETYDISGRRLQQRKISVVSGRNEVSLNVAGWPSGTYLLVLRPDNGQPALTRRLVIP